MSKRTIIICLLVVLLLIGGGYALHRYLVGEAAPGDYADFTEAIDAREETAAALKRYENGKAKPAKVLNPPAGEGKTVYLYFDGLPDRADTEKLADMLDKEKVTAAFFVEGQNAADEKENMERLHKSDYLIGNYTWLGRPQFETMETEEAISSLVKTQKAISLMGSEEALYFRAPDTDFTGEVLKEAGASGLAYAVESNVTIRRNQVNSKEDAQNLAEGIRPGSFIAFVVNRPVMEKAVEQGDYDERPAIDKKPTVRDEDYKEEPPTIPLARKVQWLVEALKEKGYDFGRLDKAD